jgi:peptidoglycan-associated lipoprotein
VGGALAGGLALALAVACGGPKFPSCDNDENCNTEGHHGVCVDHKCVECRNDEQCGAGKSCQSGTCTPIEGYCDDSHPCENGGKCGNDHRCQAAARQDVECDDEHPCKKGEKCQNGHCTAPPAQAGPGCRDFPAPKFDFESPELRADARDTLQRLATCLSSGSLKANRILLTGHCDNRGENEYNMGLGAERAEGVKNFLIGLGVPTGKLATSSRGKLDAVGTDEAGWSNDRRVDIEVR